MSHRRWQEKVARGKRVARRPWDAEEKYRAPEGRQTLIAGICQIAIAPLAGRARIFRDSFQGRRAARLPLATISHPFGVITAGRLSLASAILN